MELTENEKQAREYIVKTVFEAVDLLEAHLKKYCDEVAPKWTGQKANSVPMVYISEAINQLKSGYVNGVNKDSETEKL